MVDKYQAWDKYTDNAPAEEVKEDLRKSLQESLKDFVNNQLFQGARDLGQSAEEAYNNPNVQIDEKNFVGLSQALLDEKANINQLDAALQLVRDAPEDKRVVESFTEQGLVEIASQVEGFADIPKVSKPKKAKPKKAKPKTKKVPKVKVATQAFQKTPAQKALETVNKKASDEIKKATEAWHNMQMQMHADTMRRLEEERRAKRYAGSTGGALMWT